MFFICQMLSCLILVTCKNLFFLSTFLYAKLKILFILYHFSINLLCWIRKVYKKSSQIYFSFNSLKLNSCFVLFICSFQNPNFIFQISMFQLHISIHPKWLYDMLYDFTCLYDGTCVGVGVFFKHFYYFLFSSRWELMLGNKG